MRTWLVAVAALAVCTAGCSPKLEEGEVLEKSGGVFTIRLSKTIDKPIDQVWESFGQPERLENYSEQYEQTKLVKSEGNTKVVDYRVKALGQVNAFTMQLTLVPEDKTVKLKTLESSLVDIEGEYRLKPGEGNTTVITYEAKQTDKVNIPAPVSLQKSAIKDSFDNLVVGIEKGIEDTAS